MNEWIQLMNISYFNCIKYQSKTLLIQNYPIEEKRTSLILSGGDNYNSTYILPVWSLFS